MQSISSRIESIVVLNGELPATTDLRRFIASRIPVIAADGAAWRLFDLGILPDIIVGDLDSLKARSGYQEIFRQSEIIEDPDQETNDFEKALRLASDRHISSCLILGMQGGDLEHSFNNWSVLVKMGRQLELWIKEHDRYGVGLGAARMEACVDTDKIVSIIPQPECIVSTIGLRWPLKHEKLALGYREGARNEVIDKDFCIEIESGSAIVFVGEHARVTLVR